MHDNVFSGQPVGCHGDSGGAVSQTVARQRALVGLISAVIHPDRAGCEGATSTEFTRIDIPMTTTMLLAATGVTPLREGRLLYPRGMR